MPDVMALARELTPKLEAARQASPLPRHPDVVAADRVLRDARAEAARRAVCSRPMRGASSPPPPEARFDRLIAVRHEDRARSARNPRDAAMSAGKESCGMTAMTVVILSPHLDDAVLSLGGLIGREVAAGAQRRGRLVLHGGAAARSDRARAPRVRRLHDASRRGRTRARDPRREPPLARSARAHLARSAAAAERRVPDARVSHARSGWTSSPSFERSARRSASSSRRRDAMIYAPLAIGHHVDHVEVALAALREVLGRGAFERIRFYEDAVRARPRVSHAALRRAPPDVAVVRRAGVGEPARRRACCGWSRSRRRARGSRTTCPRPTASTGRACRTPSRPPTRNASSPRSSEYGSQVRAFGGIERVRAFVRRGHEQLGGEPIWSCRPGQPAVVTGATVTAHEFRPVERADPEADRGRAHVRRGARARAQAPRGLPLGRARLRLPVARQRPRSQVRPHRADARRSSASRRPTIRPIGSTSSMASSSTTARNELSPVLRGALKGNGNYLERILGELALGGDMKLLEGARAVLRPAAVSPRREALRRVRDEPAPRVRRQADREARALRAAHRGDRPQAARDRRARHRCRAARGVRAARDRRAARDQAAGRAPGARGRPCAGVARATRSRDRCDRHRVAVVGPASGSATERHRGDRCVAARGPSSHLVS